MTTPQLNDCVALVSRLLFDDDIRREGTVVAVAEDGMVTVAFPQAGTLPMRVTSSPEHFTVVHRAPATPLPDREQKVIEAARAWRVAVFVDRYGDSDIEQFAEALADAVDALDDDQA